jgi:hypothetical protein
MSDKTLQPWQRAALQLADFIEKSDGPWDIRALHTCFIGHFARMRSDEALNFIFDLTPMRASMRMSATVMSRLCFPDDRDEPGVAKRRYSKAQAIRTLRHYAMTGEVDWDLPEQEERVDDSVDGSRQSAGHNWVDNFALLVMATRKVVLPKRTSRNTSKECV